MPRIEQMITCRPNFLLLRWHGLGDLLGCWGRQGVHTPWCDALASQGLSFPHYTLDPATDPLRDELLPALAATGYTVRQLAAPPGPRAAPAAPALLDEAIRFVCGQVRQPQPWVLVVELDDLLQPPPPDTVHDAELAAHLVLPSHLPDTLAQRQAFAALLGLLQELDAHQARLVDELEERGIEDDTLLLLLAHGPPLVPLTPGDRRGALILRWASILPGSVTCPQLVTPADLAATLRELAGLPATTGRSLKPLLDDPLAP
jgi:arylsulfatase A-like enzyme